MLSSPRSPSRTMRIFSSAENFRRVMRRISFTTFSAGSFTGPDFRLIFAPRKATMSQKSSFLQSVQSVSQALTSDSRAYCRRHDHVDGIRMMNADVIDLYVRVGIGTWVVVL